MGGLGAEEILELYIWTVCYRQFAETTVFLLYSLDKRRKRFIIIYVWNIVNSLVLNLGIRRLCRIAPINSGRMPRHRTLRKNPLADRGPQLYIYMLTDVRGHQASMKIS